MADLGLCPGCGDGDVYPIMTCLCVQVVEKVVHVDRPVEKERLYPYIVFSTIYCLILEDDLLPCPGRGEGGARACGEGERRRRALLGLNGRLAVSHYHVCVLCVCVCLGYAEWTPH
jgi:hypothetical protein